VSRRIRLTSPSRLLACIAASLLLAACSSKPDADAAALSDILVDVADLTALEADCVADDITENADYSEFYVDDEGNPIDDPPSLDDSLEDLGDGKSDVKGLLAAFEDDVAVAVGTCTSLG
jgi:hypothetical protein